MGKFIDITGQKFNHLTVLCKYTGETNRKKKETLWMCKCDCGSNKEVIVTAYELKSNNTKSCGCIKKQHIKCKVCDDNHYAKGLCLKHYYQIKKYGKILERTKFNKNEIVIFDNYAEIILYNKNNEEFKRTKISIDKIELVQNYKWHYSYGYVVCHDADIKQISRLITNCPKDKIVDHINGDTLDNRNNNLRICTLTENSMNHKKHKNTPCKIKGVRYRQDLNKFRAHIGINNKHIHLGDYNTEEEAIYARLKAEEKYFGEYMPIKNTELLKQIEMN